jgi:micrococcal nuclease
MQKLITVLASAVVVFHTPSLNARIIRSDSVLVRAVIDGDTIDVATVGRVRLLGIDAPRIGRRLDTSAPFGREARARLTSLLLHRWVRLEREGMALNASNRHLAYVMTEDGVFVNATLVREGLARVSARGTLTRLLELQRAEADARASRRGLWGPAPQIPPASYTRPARPIRSPRSPKSRTKTPSTKRPTARKKKP